MIRPSRAYSWLAIVGLTIGGIGLDSPLLPVVGWMILAYAVAEMVRSAIRGEA